MKYINKIKNLKKLLKEKFKKFIKDESGGTLVEYALLVGFAIFMFLVIVGIIYSHIDWTLNQSNDFFDLVKNLG